MDLGSVTSGLLTGLREGVEAALIIGIILSYLSRTGRRDAFGRIWAGVAAAIAVSLAAGIALFTAVGEFQAPYEQIFEAATMLVAATVVTWMLFWMRRQSASVRNELHAALSRAIDDGSAGGLALLAFVSVIREGLETSFFLAGQATSAQAAAPWVLVGAAMGLAIAVSIGAGIYRGARRVNLGVFFRWTGISLVFIAAGLLASAVHELVEIGWISVGTGVVADLSAILPHTAIDGAPDGLPRIIGGFLHALLGYNSQPELVMVLAWAAYTGTVLALYLRPAGVSRVVATGPLAPAS